MVEPHRRRHLHPLEDMRQLTSARLGDHRQVHHQAWVEHRQEDHHRAWVEEADRLQDLEEMVLWT